MLVTPETVMSPLEELVPPGIFPPKPDDELDVSIASNPLALADIDTVVE